jgi:outer membrane protein OmpA-like peptidoglycan-associated protein
MNARRIPAALIACWMALVGVSVSASDGHDRIPLVPGLVITIATHDAQADYETLLTYTAVTPEYVEISSVARKTGSDGKPVASSRRILRADLKSSHRLIMTLQSGDPDTFPGSTLTSLSADAVRDLDSKGETAFIVGSAKLDQCVVSYDDSGIVDLLFAGGRKYYRGPLRVNADGPKSYSVLVNGERRMLPALSVRGDLQVGDAHVQPEFMLLDDADNAMIVTNSGASTQCSARVVRIDFPVVHADTASAGDNLDKALAAGACRAELHGIYFATGSADLLPPSSPTLAAVAATLQAHADWKLAVEGHTDNIGSVDYNLDLSNRRAQSVVHALVERYRVDAAHLSAHGFGLSRPVEPNTTLEGRARNRRVELARDCH